MSYKWCENLISFLKTARVQVRGTPRIRVFCPVGWYYKFLMILSLVSAALKHIERFKTSLVYIIKEIPPLWNYFLPLISPWDCVKVFTGKQESLFSGHHNFLITGIHEEPAGHLGKDYTIRTSAIRNCMIQERDFQNTTLILIKITPHHEPHVYRNQL